MKKFKIQIVLLAMLTLVFSSCEDWLDVNEDPNNTQEGRVDLLLPAAEVSVFTYFSGFKGASIGSTLGTVTHQIVDAGNEYKITSTDFSIDQSFATINSGALTDIEQIIRIGTADDDMKYVGIAKILKAYIYSVYVDVWGNVPFSEAIKMPEIMFPKYDKGETIYPELFKLIDAGLADINKDSKGSTVLADNDVIYGGDTDKWIKLANSLKLNMYNKIRLHPSFDTAAKAALVKLVADDNFIDASSAFELQYINSMTPENRNPMYVSEYGNPDATAYYISPWFYGAMKAKPGYISFLNTDTDADLVDPRTEYYFYRQTDKTKDNTVKEDKIDFYDGINNFYSVRFGSHNTSKKSSGFKNYTALGVYVCGGKFDDGTLEPGDDSKASLKGSGIAPVRLLSAHDISFIKAELAQTGNITGDAKALLTNAIEEAFAKVNAVSALDKGGITPIANADRDKYITAVMNQFAGKELEIIITEKWIAGFGNPLVSYNDYRRTGFPKLYDPNNDDAMFPVDGDLTYTSYGFPVSMPYGNSSITANKNADPQRTISSDKVFWDVN